MPAARTKTRPGKPGKTAGKGESIPLVIALPGGGQVKFYKPGDLTPRRTRELEIIGAEILPKVQAVSKARAVAVDGVEFDPQDMLNGPVASLSRAEIRAFIEFQEASAWAFLESWTLDRPLPEVPDDLQDLPRPIYEAIMHHASKLSMAGDVGFTVDALPEDPDEDADPDLPTSA